MNNETVTTANKYMYDDTNFDEIYPRNIQRLSKRHWTPINVTKLAVEFLAKDGGKILDIGSGVGKFCLAGAYFAPNAKFLGIEQREYLISNALRAQQTLDIKNVLFLHGNFTQINLQEYDHFYFFNSFHENIDDAERIDESIDYSEALYDYYVRYLYKELQQRPKGTKIVTYHAFLGEIPVGYEVVESHMNGDLNFWIKK